MKRLDPVSAFSALILGLLGALVFPVSEHLLNIPEVGRRLLTFITLSAVILFISIYSRRRGFEALRTLNYWASQQLRGGTVAGYTGLPELGRNLPDLKLLVERLSNLNQLLDSQSRAQATRISRKTRSLDTLYEVVAALNISRNREELFGSFLDTLMELLDARASSLALSDDDHSLVEVESRGNVEELTNRWAIGPVYDNFVNSVLRSGRMIVHRPDKSSADDDQSELILVPVQYRDTVLGIFTLFLGRPSAELGDDFRDLITSLGKHLGLAIEKSRLDDQSRRLAVMEERDILRNELHDTIAQYLVSMRLQVKMLGELLYKKQYRSAENEVWRLRLALEEANSSLRELLASFRFRMDERGLIPALESLVDRFGQDTGITTFFQHEVDVLDLSPSQEVELYRIVQEALANIRRHSQAATARVFLYQGQDSGYRMVVEDDGIGMEETVLEGGQGEHIGLAIMRERCRRLGGELEVESEPNEGTRVMVSLPTAGQSKSRIA